MEPRCWPSSWPPHSSSSPSANTALLRQSSSASRQLSRSTGSRWRSSAASPPAPHSGATLSAMARTEQLRSAALALLPAFLSSSASSPVKQGPNLAGPNARPRGGMTSTAASSTPSPCSSPSPSAASRQAHCPLMTLFTMLSTPVTCAWSPAARAPPRCRIWASVSRAAVTSPASSSSCTTAATVSRRRPSSSPNLASSSGLPDSA